MGGWVISVRAGHPSQKQLPLSCILFYKLALLAIFLGFWPSFFQSVLSVKFSK